MRKWRPAAGFILMLAIAGAFILLGSWVSDFWK